MGKLLCRSAVLLLAAASAAAGEGPWVSAYYPAWRQSLMPPAEIDFGAFTHLIHFSVVPRQDGSLDAAVNMMTPANAKAAVLAAHGAGRKVLFSVGGKGSREAFVGAIGRERRAAFISALLAFMVENGYDGIDLDMEEVLPSDAEDYTRFVRDLRRGLDAFAPRPLLTAAVLWEAPLFARLSDAFDQLNLMTYNLAGPYPGWVVWHSGALFDGGRRFIGGKAPLPSVDGLVERFLAAGVPRSKLGVGLSFNGYVWSGPDGGRLGQGWTTPPAMRSVPYSQLAETYGFQDGSAAVAGYHWDPGAQAPYLSFEGSAEAGTAARFVSYENEESVRRRLAYVRRKGLGGLIIWDLGAAYRPDQPPGRRDGLLQAVKRTRFGPPEAAP